MENKSEFLGTKPVGKSFLRLVIPLLFASLINFSLPIGRFIVQAFESFDSNLIYTWQATSTLTSFVSHFVPLFCFGGAIRVSYLLGQQDHENAEKTFGNCICMQVILSVFIAAILIFFKEFVISIIDKQFFSPTLLGSFSSDQATPFVIIYAVGLVLIFLATGMNYFIIAQGFTITAMISILIRKLSYYLFVLLFLGLFHLTLTGLALANVLSSILSLLWIFYFFNKKSMLKLSKRNLIPHIKPLLPCIFLGVIALFLQMSNDVISVKMNRALTDHGNVNYHCLYYLGVFGSVRSFFMQPLLAIGQGVQPIISYNYGAKNTDRLKKVIKLVLIVCLCLSTFSWLLCILFPKTICFIFAKQYGIPSSLFIHHLAGFSILGILLAFIAIFSSAEKIKPVFWGGITFTLFLPFLFITILPMLFPNSKEILLYVQPLTDGLATLFAIYLFWRFYKTLFPEKIEFSTSLSGYAPKSSR